MPRDDHPPAFLLYPQDFSSDSKVEAMTTREVGAYWLLLCKAWYETPVGTIPDNDRVLARWARLTPDEWTECRDAVLAPFKPCTDNRLLSPRLSSEYRKLMENRKKKSIAGKAGAEVRWQRYGDAITDAWQSHDSANADAMPKNAISTLSPVSTLNPKALTEEETKNPKGGVGENRDPPGRDGNPSGSSSSLYSGLRVQGLEHELPCGGFSVVEVYEAFTQLLRFHDVSSCLELSRKVQHCKTDPATWMMLFLDKIQYAYTEVDGRPRIESDDNPNPVAMTVAGFQPQKGRSRHTPTDSARLLFAEVMNDFAKFKAGGGSRWQGNLNGCAIAVALGKRKGKGRRR